MKSIISNQKECFRCHSKINLHRHHTLYGTANRKKADKDGCWIYLCGKHHNLSNEGIHFDKQYDLKIKKMTEKAWCDYYGKTKEDFLKRYGRNYLD